MGGRPESIIVTGTLRWPGNNTLNVSISMFSSLVIRQNGSHFENGRHLENRNMAHLALKGEVQ